MILILKITERGTHLIEIIHKSNPFLLFVRLDRINANGAHSSLTYPVFLLFDCQQEPGVKTMEDRWLSVDGIRAYLGVKRDTVYKWISEKAMPAHKMGRLWKFKAIEVDEWVRQGGARETHVEYDENA